MKKFPFKGVFDGLRSSVSQPAKFGTVEEFLRQEDFKLDKTVRYGFPHQPTALAYDPVQRIIAIGTKTGSIRFIGRPGVDLHVKHDSEAEVRQLLFLINEGALVAACADDSLHLWNFRQKQPSVVNSLTFSKEKITYCHLPFQSKWLYIGSSKGNVHVVNIESFILSGYVINWNKAIELQQSTHPGSVVHISDNPSDTSKLLIAFDSGLVVLWDLKNRTAENRFQTQEALRSVSWNQEGKQFLCSHVDGSLTTWSIRQFQRPVSTFFPHAKPNKDGKMEACKCIQKVEWKSCRNGESFVVFNGGLPADTRTPSLTVIRGKMTTVLEMEHTVVDFVCMSETPFSSDFQEPYAVLVLLQNDLVAVDLETQGYPCFENPYPMDIHESPVTHIFYLADCPMDAIPLLYSVGCKTQKRQGFSEREWPISGGDWGTSTASYPELIITGHADGSVKFWDASAISFQVLYKLKTGKLFERSKGKGCSEGAQEDPLAIIQMALCPESRLLTLVGASGHVMLFKFSKHESSDAIATLEIPIIHDSYDDFEYSPEMDCQPRYVPNGMYPDSDKKSSANLWYPLRVKSGSQKRASGYQVDLICLTPVVNGVPPGSISSVAVNATYGLIAYGNDSGLVVVDIIQKSCLLNLGIPDMYGSADPYQRGPRSPKSKGLGVEFDDGRKSPNIDDQEPASPTLEYVPPKKSSSRRSSCVDMTNDHSSYQKPGRRQSIFSGLSGLKKKKSTKDLMHADSLSFDDGDDTGGETPTKELDITDAFPFMHRRNSRGDDKFAHDDKPPLAPPRRGRRSSKSCSDLINDFKGGINDIKGGIKLSTHSDFRIIDLRPDDDSGPSLLGKLLPWNNDKPERVDNSFSRSRSSSMSSLDNITSESIATLVFVDSYTRKEDTTLSPTLWVGTSLGSVLVFTLNLPSGTEARANLPAMVSPSGTLFRLKGAMLTISFLDCTNVMMAPPSYQEDTKDKGSKSSRNRQSPTQGQSGGGSLDGMSDWHLAVLTSEKQARVVALPSQTCVFRQNLIPSDQNAFVVKAEVISLKDNVCLVCYLSSGHIAAHSLPSLRPLLDVEFLPLSELRITRTFGFSNHGHGVYLCSPSEIQKFTISSEFASGIAELVGEIFLPCEMPEAPKESFFKGLFGGGVRSLDREELFGESGSGRPPRGVTKPNPQQTNLQRMGTQASSAGSEISRAYKLAVERGEKLEQVSDTAERMSLEAEDFQKNARNLLLKYKDKKWYQF